MPESVVYKEGMAKRSTGSKRPLSARKKRGMTKRMDQPVKNFGEAAQVLSNLAGKVSMMGAGLGAMAVIGAGMIYAIWDMGSNVGRLSANVENLDKSLTEFKSDTKSELRAIRAELASIRDALGGKPPERQGQVLPDEPTKKAEQISPEQSQGDGGLDIAPAIGEQ